MLQTTTLENYHCLLQQAQTLPDNCSEATLTHLQNTPRVVLTSNPCPCYLETLRNLKPHGILGTWDKAIAKATAALLEGKPYFSPMLYESPLTPKEREVLHLNARGFEVKEIAVLLHSQPCTVNTHFKRIYEKLRTSFPNLKLENNRHLVFYWRGEWHLIERDLRV
jgi:DNA-binding NarL/FixJ family response regulator